MSHKLETIQLRTLFLYEFKMNHNAVEATQNINAAFEGDQAKERTVQTWFKKFKEGDFNLYDEPRSGRPRNIDEDEFRAAVEEDPHQSLADLAERFEISESGAGDYMKRIGMVKKLDKWVHQ